MDARALVSLWKTFTDFESARYDSLGPIYPVVREVNTAKSLVS
jgi:hypothetical protein